MATNTKIVTTQDQKTANLFGEHEKFLIPPFQRAYTWKPRHIGTLWQDMLENEKGYFVGSTVLLESTEKKDNRLTVIDGQQRLFTISLYILALEEKWREIKEYLEDDKDKENPIKQADKLRDKYLIYDESSASSLDNEYVLRVRPVKSNLREIYEDLIFKEVNPQKGKMKEFKKKYDAHQMRFIRNHKRIQKMAGNYVEGESYQEKAKKLEDLTERVLQLLFITILCSTESDAYKIFEGLNATGVGLTVSDLVKNAVLRGAREKDRNGIRDTWEDMEAIFEKADKLNDFPRYLRHQWISQNGYITKSKLYDKIKERKIEDKKSSAIKKYANNLLEDAKIYAGLRFKDYEKELELEEETLDIIKRFRFLKVKQAYEVLLAYYKKFKEKEDYTEKQLRRQLKDLWVFCFRAMIVNLNPSDYERIFAKYCKYINDYSGKKFNRIDSDFKKELKEVLENTEDKFIENLSTDFEYKTSNTNLITYLFKELFREKDASLKVAKPTIEHILPQNPHKWGFEKEDVSEFVDKIGNLTLLFEKDNKKVGNAPMEAKVEKIFSESKLERHQKIAGLQKKFEDDPEKIIEKRSKEISEEINSMDKFNFN